MAAKDAAPPQRSRPAREIGAGSPPVEHDDARPLLMVDIDGVLSLFMGSTDRVEGSFHSIEGIPHFLSATAAAHLLALHELFAIVWASGWEEKAEEHLPHLLGVPAGLPYLRFPRAVGRANAHWKLETIDAYAGEQPLAWVDDALNAACHEWASAREAPTLLVQTEPQAGLTERETRLLARWARELTAAG